MLARFRLRALRWLILGVLPVACTQQASKKEVSMEEVSMGGKLVALIKCNKAEYLLGEPIWVDVILWNNTKAPVRSFEPYTDPCEPEIKVLIGGAYQQVGFGDCKKDRRLFTLEPNEEKRFGAKVLYAYKQENGLAISKPGNYSISALSHCGRREA